MYDLSQSEREWSERSGSNNTTEVSERCALAYFLAPCSVLGSACRKKSLLETKTTTSGCPDDGPVPIWRSGVEPRPPCRAQGNGSNIDASGLGEVSKKGCMVFGHLNVRSLSQCVDELRDWASVESDKGGKMFSPAVSLGRMKGFLMVLFPFMDSILLTSAPSQCNLSYQRCLSPLCTPKCISICSIMASSIRLSLA